jgi:UDP:flavonoid glycosyltransferase YjiC (YdhE family)
MLDVADVISKRGGEVQFSSSSEVAKLLEDRGYRCNRLPLADVIYSGDGAFSLRGTMKVSPRILARAYQQVYMEAANITRFRPVAVLSDSSLPTVLAARLCKVPVFTVLNQLSLTSSHENRSPAVSLLSVGTSAGMGKLWELSDEVFLPDLPPPYTISEKNLWGSGVSKTKYIGFLHLAGEEEPDRTADEFNKDKRKKVFWQISGPPKTREPFLRIALEIAKSLSDSFVFVISAGNPSGSTEAAEISGGWFYGWCRSPDRFFSSCDFVISRAGHGTIGQAILASKPSLLVPIPKQPEQAGNALKAAQLGIAQCIDQCSLDYRGVAEAAQSLLDGETTTNVRRLGSYASQFDAVEEVVTALTRAAG